MKDEAGIWLSYADENLKSAKILLNQKLFNPCLQNVQQSIEKYLKAMLLEKDQKSFKTHSICELVKKIGRCHVHINLSADDCDLLDAIYLPSKYPLSGALPEFSPDEEICTTCLNLAERVAKQVHEIIKG